MRAADEDVDWSWGTCFWFCAWRSWLLEADWVVGEERLTASKEPNGRPRTGSSYSSATSHRMLRVRGGRANQPNACRERTGLQDPAAHHNLAPVIMPCLSPLDA